MDKVFQDSINSNEKLLKIFGKEKLEEISKIFIDPELSENQRKQKLQEIIGGTK